MNEQILIAGIGNIFFGDDAFGVEQELLRRSRPPHVEVIDFGVRSYDLAYALAEGYAAVILVDATPRGHEPGTVYLIEADLERLGALDEGVDAHSMNPVRVLQMAKALGAPARPVYVVGCEPGHLGSEDGYMGLSEAVRAAVPKAIEMIESLVSNLSKSEIKSNAGLAAA
jgi:hydrogenase maturation protease